MTDTTTAPTSAPKDTLDSQVQGHIEHAEQEAELAQKKSEALTADLTALKAEADSREAPPAPEPGEISDAQKQQISERAQVVTTQLGEPAVQRVVTEEQRLALNKEQVVNHLNSASPDMSPAFAKAADAVEAPADAPVEPDAPSTLPGNPPA
jgi:hypothetical protein